MGTFASTEERNALLKLIVSTTQSFQKAFYILLKILKNLKGCIHITYLFCLLTPILKHLETGLHSSFEEETNSY